MNLRGAKTESWPRRGSGLNDLLERRAVADHQGRALELQELFLLELRKQPADGLASGADDIGDLLVSQGQLDLCHSFVLRTLRRPGQEEFCELFRRRGGQT